jgi:hypothetical protein
MERIKDVIIPEISDIIISEITPCSFYLNKGKMGKKCLFDLQNGLQLDKWFSLFLGFFF